MCDDLNQYGEEYVLLWKLINKNFFHNSKKTTRWMNTANPLLGGKSPADAIYDGEYNKLLDIIKTPTK